MLPELYVFGGTLDCEQTGYGKGAVTPRRNHIDFPPAKDRSMPILDAETALFPDNLLSELAAGNSPRRWWAIYTKARQEKALARHLVQLNVPFYLPLIPKTNLIRGRKVQSHIPLFSGYVFLFGTEDERTKSLTTNRVSTILNVDDQRQLASDLRHVARLIESNAPLTVERRLEAGAAVRIKTGPMQGLEGTVISRRGQTRLLVSVRMLQQGVSVEIDDFVLEPIA
jgi:transcriptional antiterminator RfaH